MREIGIIPNLDKDINLEFTEGITRIIEDNNCIPLVTSDVATKSNIKVKSMSQSDVYKSSDFVIILGGDGTMLRESHVASLYDTPILGINLGRLGFLTDCDRNGANVSIQKAVNGIFNTEKRMMLDVVIYKNGVKVKESIVLNDVCLSRGNVFKMIEFDLCVNNEYINFYRADGIIVSTPTGSTAYNLSAGGPILKFDSSVIAVTPICPHDLFARSIILNHDDVIRISIKHGFKGDVSLSADGELIDDLKDNDYVEIKRSKRYVNIIKTTNKGFYDVLREKMLGGEKTYNEDRKTFKNI